VELDGEGQSIYLFAIRISLFLLATYFAQNSTCKIYQGLQLAHWWRWIQ